MMLYKFTCKPHTPRAVQVLTVQSPIWCLYYAPSKQALLLCINECTMLAEIDSVSDKEPTENGADSKPEQTTSSEQETEPTVSSESSNIPQEKREGGGAGVVGAAVAATVVALLIIVVVIVSVLVYLSRRKIERALIRTLTSSQFHFYVYHFCLSLLLFIC